MIVEIITTDSLTEQKLITHLGRNFHQVRPPKGMSLLPFRLLSPSYPLSLLLSLFFLFCLSRNSPRKSPGSFFFKNRLKPLSLPATHRTLRSDSLGSAPPDGSWAAPPTLCTKSFLSLPDLGQEGATKRLPVLPVRSGSSTAPESTDAR